MKALALLVGFGLLLPQIAFSDVTAFLTEGGSSTDPVSATALYIGETRTFNLYLETASTPSARDACEAGAGDEICYWDLHLDLTDAVIDSFVPVEYVISANTLSGGFRANGGDPISGQLGSEKLGTIDVMGTSAGSMSLTASEYVDAGLVLQPVPDRQLLTFSQAPAVDGSGGNDNLEGHDYYDIMNGQGGDDQLEGKGGNDQLNGGAGSDTAIFSGSWSDYIVTGDGTSSTVSDQRSIDGDDSLSLIEYLQFLGGGTGETYGWDGFEWILVPEASLFLLQGVALLTLFSLARMRRRYMQTFAIAAIASFMFAGTAVAEYQWVSGSLSGGGYVASQPGDRLSGSIGQGFVGFTYTTDKVVAAGFWNLVVGPLALDPDGDNIHLFVDNCPYASNPSQTASTDEPTIGTACLCGDINDDGTVDSIDLVSFRSFLADRLGFPINEEKCTVIEQETRCNILDAAVIDRSLEPGDYPPYVSQACRAAKPASGE